MDCKLRLLYLDICLTICRDKHVSIDMILLQLKYAHIKKKECSDPNCMHSYIISDWCTLDTRIGW